MTCDTAGCDAPEDGLVAVWTPTSVYWMCEDCAAEISARVDEAEIRGRL